MNEVLYAYIQTINTIGISVFSGLGLYHLSIYHAGFEDLISVLFTTIFTAVTAGVLKTREDGWKYQGVNKSSD